jgi:hypothetical protein
MMVPVVLGVMVTKQLEVVALTVASVHGDPLTAAVAVPPLVNETIPAGALPPTVVSLTNAVHVVDCATTTVVGVQDTAVVVPRRLTVTVLLVAGPLLL